MYNLIFISQAGKIKFKVSDDDEEGDPRSTVLKLMHKQSGEIKMMGVETISGLYEVVVTMTDGEENIMKNENDQEGMNGRVTATKKFQVYVTACKGHRGD